MHIAQQLTPFWNTNEPSDHCHTLDDQLSWLTHTHDGFKLSTTNQSKTFKHGYSPELLTSWLSSNLHDAIVLFSETNNVNHTVAASMWLKSFNNHFFTTLVALRMKFHRVPILQFNDIMISTPNGEKIKALQLTADCPFVCLENDPLSDSKQATTVKNQQELDDAFTHLLQQIGGGLSVLFEKERLKHRPFWGSISLAVSVFFMRLTEHGIAPASADELAAQAQQWLDTVMPETGKNLAHIKVARNTDTAILYVQRETCCMKYKIEDKKHCATCQLLDDGERHQKNIKRIPIN